MAMHKPLKQNMQKYFASKKTDARRWREESLSSEENIRKKSKDVHNEAQRKTDDSQHTTKSHEEKISRRKQNLDEWETGDHLKSW